MVVVLIKLFKDHIVFFILLSILFSQGNIIGKNIGDSNQISSSGEQYFTSDDGIIRIYVNVIGHVKNPGTYLVYEDVDLLTLLSIAGGPLPGANFKSIKLYNNGEIVNLNLKDIMTKTTKDRVFKIKPNNTILVEQKLFYSLYATSNVFTSLLTFINLYISISQINA